MKLTSLLVGASLVLNAVLLVALGRGLFGGGSSAPAAVAPVAPSVAAKPAAAPGAPADAWAELEAGDLAAQAARLKAEGFPPAMTRAIMAAQIRAQFAARRKSLDAASAATPFWDTNVDPKIVAEQRALAREEQKALRDLLGPDPENGTAARLRRTYPELAPDKVEQMAQMRDRYDEKRSDIYAANGNAAVRGSEEMITALDKAFRAELATVLSPQELEEYDMRESRTATQLRYNLTAFDASEQEYRALFKLQSAFDERFGPLAPGQTVEQRNARNEGQKILTEDIKAALGEERFAEYTRGTDYNYRRTTQLVARLNLPPETANEIYAVQFSTQQRLTEMRRPGQPMNPTNAAERNAQLTVLAAEAEAKITAKLGPAGFEAYKQNAGSWLSNIVPQQRPPPPPRQ